jgi:hypothetical protein
MMTKGFFMAGCQSFAADEDKGGFRNYVYQNEKKQLR